MKLFKKALAFIPMFYMGGAPANTTSVSTQKFDRATTEERQQYMDAVDAFVAANNLPSPDQQQLNDNYGFYLENRNSLNNAQFGDSQSLSNLIGNGGFDTNLGAISDSQLPTDLPAYDTTAGGNIATNTASSSYTPINILGSNANYESAQAASANNFNTVEAKTAEAAQAQATEAKFHAAQAQGGSSYQNLLAERSKPYQDAKTTNSAYQAATAQNASPYQSAVASTTGNYQDVNAKNTPEYQNANAAFSDLVSARNSLGEVNPTHSLEQLLSGRVSNPYLQQMNEANINQSLSAYHRAIQEVNQSVMPQINNDAFAAGQYGGSRQGIAQGLALQQLDRNAADLSIAAQGYGNQLYGNAYQAAQDNMATTANNLNQQAGVNSQFNAQNAQQANFTNAQNNLQNNQFNVSQSNDIAQLNANNRLQNSQFNVGQQNSIAQLNANNLLQNNQFDANQQNAMSQFNAGNAMQTNLANSSAANEMQRFNATNNLQNNQFNATIGNEIGRFNTTNNLQNNQFNAAAQNDITKLNAQHQAQIEMANANAANQIALENAKAQTAASQFNADAFNQATQLNATQQAQIDQLNAQLQTNTSLANANNATQNSQFNAAQQNDIATTTALTNAANSLQNNQFNASAANNMAQFNTTQANTSSLANAAADTANQQLIFNNGLQNNQFNANLGLQNNTQQMAQSQQNLQNALTGVQTGQVGLSNLNAAQDANYQAQNGLLNYGLNRQIDNLGLLQNAAGMTTGQSTTTYGGGGSGLGQLIGQAGGAALAGMGAYSLVS